MLLGYNPFIVVGHLAGKKRSDAMGKMVVVVVVVVVVVFVFGAKDSNTTCHHE